MASEERAQKFQTDDAPLPRSGCLLLRLFHIEANAKREWLVSRSDGPWKGRKKIRDAKVSHVFSFPPSSVRKFLSRERRLRTRQKIWVVPRHFCYSRFSDVISRVNQWWRREMRLFLQANNFNFFLILTTYFIIPCGTKFCGTSVLTSSIVCFDGY